MANQKGTPRKIDAKLVDDRNKPIERRRVTDFLPAVNNSDLIKKFFAGSVDSLFQPEQTEKLSGFIGRIPQHAELEKEFYIDEPTKERTEYQLDPTAISTDPETGEIENILFYDDLPNLLRFSGGIVNNHDRLFETDFYSWCPPIDLDKLMNFTNYFWFETGPEVFRFTELTNAEGLIGTANPVSIQGINFVDELLVVFENDINILFRNRLFVVGGVGTSLTLTLVSTLESFVWDDIIGWDAGPWDGPDPQLSVGIDPDYIVMERGARDGNLWSIGNKWYHRDELNSTQLSIALERQAQRSIIEFKRDLELYNHGTFGRTPVTVRDDETTDPDVQIVGKLIPVTIDGIELNNGDTILFTQGPALSGVWDIQGWDFEDPSSITLINDDLLNPVPVTGTVVGPTTTIGDTIIINNVTVILTGTTLASTIIDINNASIEASAVILEVISVVVASDNGGALELNASIISLQEGNGTALTDLGLIEGTFGHPQLNQDEFDQNTTGGWDPFFNVAYSAVPGDITLFNIPPTPGQIFTSTGDFVALGFVPGMVIDIAGSTGQDGRYTIDTVISNTITLIEPFTGATGIGLPQPGNITITEFRRVFKNRIFKVSGVGSSTGITLELVADGQNEDGSPSDGDQVKVLLGIVHQNNVYYWSDAEDLWIEAQQKLTINQAPLFQLYDTVATQLQDPGKYPFSTFQGSKIFGYQINEDPRQPLDTVLEFPLKFNEFGEPTFENFLVTERVNFNNPVEEIIGYYFHRTIGDTAEQDFFSNDWYLSAIRSRQFLSNNFTADGTTQEFKLTLEPENLDEVEVFINGQQEQIEGWNIVGTTITFITEINKSDEIRIKYFSFENPPDDSTAVYEIPANLEGNPDNEEITFIANADFFKHFTEIIRRQIGFAGNANGSNNYRNTPRDRSLGTEILQHRAPMLKVMGLGSNINIDYIRSVRYVEREFSRFRNKFLKKVNEFFNDGIHTVTQPPSEWIEDALESINLGRVTEFPFAFSGMGTRISGEPTFIPSSPSRLGVYPVYTPQIFDDLTYQTPRKVIQFHDGSVIVAFNDFRDDVILELENNIFNAIPDEYKTEERPDFDWVDFVASQFRTGDYSIAEFNKLLTPIIDRWAVTHVLNLTENTSFDITNPFSWNYGKQGLPGYWRGIFKLFYDTDRPNTHPWEILGFSQEPDWWAGRYGVAPFVATNTLLWNDVLSGQIAFGPRAGIDLRYLKPGVPIPVDGIGNLLDPVTLGLAKEPGLVDKQANWKIGDHGPVETVFRRSEFWSYAIAQISYLMKPARFIELGWEPDKQLFRYNNQEHPQWIDTSTEDRKRHSEYFVHGEELSDETIRRSNGIQQWITEFLVSIGKEVKSNFGDVIRTMQVRLGHRMAGFINPNSTRILADNFGLVPQEDIELQSYTNPSIREEFYGGVIIERVEKGWSVFGYDVLDPVFRVLPSINSNQRIVIEVSSIRVIEFKRFSPEPIVVPYNTVFTTQQEVYDFLIGYGRFLESNGWVFDEVDLDNNETNNWRLAGKQFLFWSLGRWAIGSLIAVSPSSQKVKFVTDQGTIQSVEQVINGVYGLLNKDGGVIQPRDTFVSRFEGEINITPNDEHSVYSSRLFIAETEHTLIFNNRTIFNDLIYNPLFKLRQSRFKLFTTRARGWKGRLDAPGFIVTEDNLIPNYEKTVNDFRRYFEIENGVERSVINDTARRLFGFQIRPYLDDLLFNRDTQFQFYQGFIRQKGTGLVLDKLLRSDISTEADNVQFFEEWALRLGEYGAVQDSITVEFLLREDEYRASPQLVEFKGSTLAAEIFPPEPLITTSITISDASTFPNSGIIRVENEQISYTSKSINTLDGLTRGVNDTEAVTHNVGTLVGFVDVPFDDILVISNDDERWVIRPPEDGLVRFPFRNPSVAKRSKNAAYLFRTDIPSSGYPLETEVTFHVTDIEERDEIFDLQRITLEAEDLEFGDTIWVDNIRNFYDNSDPNSVFNFGFMVYRFTDTGLSFEIPKLSIGVGDRTLIITNLPHGFTKDQRIMIANNENTVPDLNGSYLVRFVTSVLGSGFTSPTEGETFVINDITITVDGTTITEVIETIDAAKVAGLLVYEDSSEIRLVNLEGDDFILVEGTGTALFEIGFAEATITNNPTNMFSIANTITTDDNGGPQPGNIGVFTESRFIDEAARDSAIINNTPPVTPIPWTVGELSYVDKRVAPSDPVPLWAVFEYDGTTPWVIKQSDNVDRFQSLRVDTELFKQSLLYNKQTNITDAKLNIWDPAKGLFPGQALNDIDFKVEYDPAKYTNGDEEEFQIDPLEAWSELQVGQVWWDLSTTEYINYETGSNRERRNKWGRLTEGKSIDVYEWIRSSVPPTQWADLVENNADQPEESFRYKPSGEAFKVEETENPPFTQKIVRNEITGDDNINYYFWVKNSNTLPNIQNRDFTVSQITRQLTNPTSEGIPWWAPIDEHSLIFSGIEALLTRNDSVLQVNYDFTRNQNNLHREWILTREGDETQVPTDRFWNKMTDSLVGFNVENLPVPSPTLEESRKLGNFIRPRQTWFNDRESAGRIFIDCVNDQLRNICIVDEREDLFDSLFAKSPEPTEYIGSDPQLLCEYDFHVANNQERDLLPALSDLDQIWVDGTTETGGFWKVYQFNAEVFVEICSESFRLEDFWTQIDFFVEDVDPNIDPDITVETINDRNLLTNTGLTEGTVVRVNDSNSDGNETWSLFKFTPQDLFSPWVLIAKKDCTLEFNTDLFYNSDYGNPDVRTISKHFPEGISGNDQALKAFIEALRNDISTDLEENLLFFKMINYVHSEQLLVDWAFKTTYLFALGFNKAATQEPILRPDPTENFIEFIQEAKPYHTKLRDFITNQDFSLDIHETNITDFDKPVHFDNSLEEFRVLDSNDVDDKAIMALPDAAQNSWFNTFSTAPELIRSLTTTLLFDRVSCDLAGGWDPTFGWDFGPNEDWDLALSDVNETAAERIIKFYNPQPFTVEDLDTGNIDPIIDLTALISGCDFKGTIVDGKDFNILDIDVDTDLFGGEPSLAITSSIQVNYGNHSGLMLPVSVDSFAQGDGIINPIESIFIIGTSDGGPSVIPELITSVIVLVDNVIQIEGLLNDYTVSGDTLTFNVSSIPPANSGIQIVIAEFEIPFASTGNFRISLNTGSGRIEQNDPADFTEIGSRIVFVNPPSVGPAGSDLVEIFDNFVRIFPVPVGITAPISVSVNGILKTPGGSGFDYFDGGTFIEFQLESIPNHGEVVSIADDVTLLEAPTGAVDIIVDGNLFRQPDIDAGHPEELILNSVGEALAICVNSKERVNAPQVLTRRYVGFGVGPYPIDQIPASKDALWIYLNGVKQPFDDFDFDNVFNTISFTTATPGPNDIVVVTSFALGGGEESIILQEFAGNGIDDTFTLPVTPVSEGSVFVTVDGIVQTQGITKDYTINLAGPEIIFNFIPVNGADIDVCIFASENFTSIKSTKHIVSSPLIAPASNTYALDQEIDSRDPIDFKDPNRLNDIANIFVSVNGVRQKPFSASEFGGWSTTSLPWSSSTWSSLNIDFDYIVRFNDGSGLEDQVVFPVKVLTDPNPVYNTGDSFSINETTVTLTGSTTIDVIHDINNTMIADILAMRDRSGTSIQIMNVVGGSIKLDNVSGTPLSDLGISGPFPKTIESVLSENDVVYISSMNNDYSIARELYDGVTNTFGMIQDVTIEDQIDLFINGIFVKRDPGPPNYTVDVSANTVTLTNDFLITAGITVGLNIGSLIEIVTYYTSTDTFTGDSTGNQAEYTISQVVDDVQKLFVSVNGIRQLAGIDYSIIGGDLIQFTRSHVDMDEIIITALTGPASAPKIAFRQFLNNFEAQQAQDLIQPFAISTLDDNILSTDLLITLVDRTGFPDQGIIIIGTDVGDTIEYEFVRYDGFDVNNKLIVIERGANNTTPADHFIGDIALILNPLIPQIANIEAHRISDDGKATLTQPLELGDTEIHLNRVAGLPKQPLGEKRLAKPGVIWIGTERIEFLERDGTILKQIIRGTKGTSSGVPAVYDLSGDLLSDVFTGGTLIYPVGTVVIDGSNKQRIPGGYEWEPAPFGLQFSNSSQARFLKNRPGSC